MYLVRTFVPFRPVANGVAEDTFFVLFWTLSCNMAKWFLCYVLYFRYVRTNKNLLNFGRQSLDEFGTCGR